MCGKECIWDSATSLAMQGNKKSFFIHEEKLLIARCTLGAAAVYALLTSAFIDTPQQSSAWHVPHLLVPSIHSSFKVHFRNLHDSTLMMTVMRSRFTSVGGLMSAQRARAVIL